MSAINLSRSAGLIRTFTPLAATSGPCHRRGRSRLVAGATTAARADSIKLVTSQAAQASSDAVKWSQIGPNETLLGSSFGANSGVGSAVTVKLNGSALSVTRPAAPGICSWGGKGVPQGDTVVSTSDSQRWRQWSSDCNLQPSAVWSRCATPGRRSLGPSPPRSKPKIALVRYWALSPKPATPQATPSISA
jgi:hypothetical protein